MLLSQAAINLTFTEVMFTFERVILLVVYTFGERFAFDSIADYLYNSRYLYFITVSFHLSF